MGLPFLLITEVTCNFTEMDNSIEIWKDVNGYEGHYQVSNLGNLRRCNEKYKDIPVPLEYGKDGRVYARLRIGRSKKLIPLCLIVATAFVSNDSNSEDVSYIDNNPKNCSASNLKWNIGFIGEEWKDIKGYEGFYQVSSLGRVRSVERIVKVGDFFVTRRSKIRKLNKRPNGYYGLLLSRDDTNVNFSIHRLVAEAFIPNPLCLPQINHKNENKADNRVENLEWCTAKYNSNYGTRKERVMQNNKRMQGKKIVCMDVNGNILQHYPSVQSVKKNGHNVALVHACCTGARHTHHGLYWKFE